MLKKIAWICAFFLSIEMLPYLHKISIWTIFIPYFFLFSGIGWRRTFKIIAVLCFVGWLFKRRYDYD